MSRRKKKGQNSSYKPVNKVTNVVDNPTESKVIESYEELESCEDKNLLDETIENRKTQIQTDDIYIKVLENNIIKLNEEILEIQKKEIAHINAYNEEYINRKKQLEEEFEVSKNNLIKEKEELIREYDEKKNKLDEIYFRRSDSQKEEYQKTLKDLDNKRKNLENEFEEKNKDLENKYCQKEEALVENTNQIIDEYNNLKKSLEEEYDLKTKKLEEEYTSKNEDLLQKYNEKYQLLTDEFASKEKDLMDEYNAKEDFLKDYEKDLEESNREQYEELMDKIRTSKDEFEALMKKQRELFQEEVNLKNLEMQEEIDRINNDLKEKEALINSDYNEKMCSLKQSEIEFLQKENELNQKIADLNEKVKNFNESKNKFVKRHYLTRRIYEKIKKHRIKTGIITACLFLVTVYLGLVFEYNLFRKDFVSESITNVTDLDSYDNTITVYLDTSNATFAKFTEMDGLRMKMNYKYNNEHFQNLNTYSLSFGDNDYKWERYYKNDTMIARSAFYGQYIIVENYDDYGYVFKESEEIDIFIKSFREFLAKKNNFDFDEVNRLNIEGNNSFFEYLKQGLVLSSNYEYYYNLKSDSSKECNNLFDNMFKIFLESDNYTSFEAEEADFQKALGMADVLASSKDILKNIVEYSTVEDIDMNVKINKGNLANIVDVYFNLAYQDDTMVNSVPMGIRITCEFNQLDETLSLDDNEFTTNAVFYEGLGK